MKKRQSGIEESPSSGRARRRIILASQSPRRRELLVEAGISFEVIVPHPSAEPEGAQPAVGESTSEFVERLALQKAVEVAKRVSFPAFVIGCDTVAEVDNLILGKPVDLMDARRILKLLNGRCHSVWSGLAVVDSTNMQSWIGHAESQLDLHFPDEQVLEQYLESGQWQGKSGAFGFQDSHPWLSLKSGTKENVVGLPLDLLARLLHKAGKGGQLPVEFEI